MSDQWPNAIDALTDSLNRTQAWLDEWRGKISPALIAESEAAVREYEAAIAVLRATPQVFDTPGQA